jgi:6-phosphogluconolactonase
MVVTLEAAGQCCRWHPVSDRHALSRVATARILAAAERALDARGQFHLVLAGGNTPRQAYQELRAAPAEWAAWHIYFGDERCLPPTDPARNSRMAGDAWLDHVAIAEHHRHPIPAELGPDEAAVRYAAVLRPVGEFDLVLLGLGEDGHTASLFPGHDWGEAFAAPPVLAVQGAPKAPPQRVSLSARRLSDAREVVFLVAGRDKRGAVAQWRAGARIPARAIVPAAGVDVVVESALLPPAG